jgi:hypothetical protein
MAKPRGDVAPRRNRQGIGSMGLDVLYGTVHIKGEADMTRTQDGDE